MGTIRKVGDKYRAEVCIGRRRQSKTWRTKREANQWITDLENSGFVTGKVTLSELINKYLDEVGVYHKGYRQEKLRLELIKSELPDIPVSKLTPSILTDWKNEKLKKVSAPTVRRYMACIGSVFRYGLELQIIGKNPLEGVRKPPSAPPRNVYPSDDDIQLILEQLQTGKHKKQVATTLLLALETAMRAGEILSLNRSNIDYSRRVATLTDTKNRDTREVPLSSKAIELLKSVDPEYFTVSSAVHSRLFHVAAKSAGVAVRFHDSRAAGLMRLSKKVDVLTLARIAGMRDTKTLMIYYRERAEDIAKLLD